MAAPTSQSTAALPSASSPSLVLTSPTPAERTRTWSASHAQWGGALSLQGYLDREAHLMGIPLSRDGGLALWILTDNAVRPQEDRPVLASCDTLRKRALVRGPDGVVREGFAHGVASVFTYPECRGRGYAGRMMALLGETLGAREKKQPGDAMFSVLYSDIGKKFYAARGWKPFQSSHLEFSTSSVAVESADNVKPIGYDDLALFAELDEKLVRKQIAAAPAAGGPSTRVALIPDLDAFQWHLLREDFMCKHIFSKTPSARGAVYTQPGSPHRRVWGLWIRSFYGGTAHPERNKLTFLRFVVEDGEGMADAELATAAAAIVGAAQREAAEWLCAKVEMWNPEARVRRVVEGIEGLGARFVEREGDSICSLNWFGGGSVDDVEWVANDKFGWC